MGETKREDLKKAHGKENNPGAAARVQAARMACAPKGYTGETAVDLMRIRKRACGWRERYGAGGPDGLRNLPKKTGAGESQARGDEQNNLEGRPRRMRAQGAAGARTRRDRRQAVHRVRRGIIRWYGPTPMSRRRYASAWPAGRLPGTGGTALTDGLQARRGKGSSWWTGARRSL